MAVYTMWQPMYRLEGIIKGLTAFISIVTAIMLIPITPKALKFPSLHQLNQELTRQSEELAAANEDLEKFKHMALGREDRVLELKKEVNKLSKDLGLAPPYKLTR